MEGKSDPLLGLKENVILGKLIPAGTGLPRYRDIEVEHSLRLPVVEAQVQYKLPARYDDLLSVETSLTEARRASVRFQYRILRGGELLASGHTVHACIDLEGRLQRVPGPVIDRLTAGEPGSIPDRD